ncbi:MAG: hypothetical protein ACR2NX_00195 [Chthoniobacterales bacterium]
MPRPDDFMLTAEERRLRDARRRRLRLLLAGVVILALLLAFGVKPAGRAIKSWQARRHAQKAFALIEGQHWSDARAEALAAYQLRASEPEAIRAVARFLSRTRQQQALEFWTKLRDTGQPLTREDLRDEAATALGADELARAQTAIDALLARQDAGPPDYLLAAQWNLQRGQRSAAEADLAKILADPKASEREQLQAILAQLGLAEAEKDPAKQKAAQDRLIALSRFKTEAGLSALVLRAQRALATAGAHTSAQSPHEPAAVPPADLAQALQNHPLAKAPQKLLALDLLAQADPSQREALIARGIAEWKNGDPEALTALAVWLNGKGEHQKVLDSVPLATALASRDLFLQYVDALGALARWSEIQQLLESERAPLDPVTTRMYLARCNAQLGETTAAENNWKRALEAARGDPQKLMTLAAYAEKNGALEIATAAYNATVAAVPNLRPAQEGRLRLAAAERDTQKLHSILADMLRLWPNDTAIQNDEAYLRVLLLGGPGSVPSQPKPDAAEGVPQAQTSATAISSTSPSSKPSPAPSSIKNPPACPTAPSSPLSGCGAARPPAPSKSMPASSPAPKASPPPPSPSTPPSSAPTATPKTPAPRSSTSPPIASSPKKKRS